MVKNSPPNARDIGSIPGSGRSPGEGHSNSLQYSCVENPMDRGAWQATVHRVAKTRTQLKQFIRQMTRISVMDGLQRKFVSKAMQREDSIRHGCHV